MNEGEVFLCLYGDDFDPNDVAQLIGLEPTKMSRKGNPAYNKNSCLDYSTGEIVGEVVDVYELSSSLIARLGPYSDKILKAINDYDLKAVLQVFLTITPDDTKSTPAIGFETDVIAFLHKIGATIDIDTYRGES